MGGGGGGGGGGDAETEQNPEEPELELSTRNKLVPPGKKSKRANRHADKLRMPGQKYNGIGR